VARSADWRCQLGPAVAEEVWFRLGLMSCLVWLLMKTAKRSTPDAHVIWLSIGVLAVLFGAAHLPQLASFGAATPFAMAGTIFGKRSSASFTVGFTGVEDCLRRSSRTSSSI
jgi:membrane protease YdiL (CAAX protease family)